MIILPAIDLRGGRAVRLTKGDYDQMKVYSDDPASVAGDFWRRARSGCMLLISTARARACRRTRRSSAV